MSAKPSDQSEARQHRSVLLRMSGDHMVRLPRFNLKSVHLLLRISTYLTVLLIVDTAIAIVDNMYG